MIQIVEKNPEFFRKPGTNAEKLTSSSRFSMATVSPPSRTSSVIIMGGGVVGCFLAYCLTLAGMPATVIERERMGAEAEVIKIHSLLDATLKEHFNGWQAAVFTGRPDLGLGLRDQLQLGGLARG